VVGAIGLADDKEYGGMLDLLSINWQPAFDLARVDVSEINSGIDCVLIVEHGG
jgi:hypothetical protein